MKQEDLKVFICDTYQHSIFKPDNYVSFSNPDYLISDEGRLYGIFVPKSEELKNVNHLLRRVYASRIAYSQNMEVVLINGDCYEREFHPIINQSFTRVLESEDEGRRVVLALKDNNIREKDYRIRRSVYNKQNYLFKNSFTNRYQRERNINWKEEINFSKDRKRITVNPWAIKNRNRYIGITGTYNNTYVLEPSKTITDTMLTSLFFHRYGFNDGMLTAHKYNDTFMLEILGRLDEIQYERDVVRFAYLGVELL